MRNLSERSQTSIFAGAFNLEDREIVPQEVRGTCIIQCSFDCSQSARSKMDSPNIFIIIRVFLCQRKELVLGIEFCSVQVTRSNGPNHI